MKDIGHCSEKLFLPFSSEDFFIGSSADFIERYPHKVDYITNYKQLQSDNLTILLINEYAKLSHIIELNKKYLIENVVIIIERNAHATITLDMFPKSISVIGMHESFLRIIGENKKLNNKNVFFSIMQDFASTIELFFSITASTASSLRIDSYLNQEQSSIIIGGSYELNFEEKLNIEINQHHKAKLTTSKIKVNGVLKSNASSNFSGTIIIEPQAQYSNAQLSNKNLLVDNHAQATSRPNLEIKTNNVQCKHASAIGYICQDQCWLLQIRGYNEEKANSLLADSFLNEVKFSVTD